MAEQGSIAGSSNKQVQYLCLLVAIACGCGPSANSAKHDDPKRDIEFANLVECLASKNEEPQITQGPFSSKVLLAPSFDKAEQQRVYECYKALLDGEAKSFSALITHLNDPRYCQTGLGFGEESVFRNYSVGVVCRFALQLQLDAPYLEHIHVYGLRDYFHRFSYVDNIVGDADKARLWADRHRGNTLAEIQCEAIEWFLSAIPRFGEIGPTAEEAAEVKSLLQTIRKTSIPVRIRDSTMKPRYKPIYEDRETPGESRVP